MLWCAGGDGDFRSASGNGGQLYQSIFRCWLYIGVCMVACIHNWCVVCCMHPSRTEKKNTLLNGKMNGKNFVLKNEMHNIAPEEGKNQQRDRYGRTSLEYNTLIMLSIENNNRKSRRLHLLQLTIRNEHEITNTLCKQELSCCYTQHSHTTNNTCVLGWVDL